MLANLQGGDNNWIMGTSYVYVLILFILTFSLYMLYACNNIKCHSSVGNNSDGDRVLIAGSHLGPL